MARLMLGWWLARYIKGLKWQYANPMGRRVNRYGDRKNLNGLPSFDGFRVR